MNNRNIFLLGFATIFGVVALIGGIFLFLYRHYQSEAFACYQTGGEWREYSDGCTNTSCKERTEKKDPRAIVLCTQAFEHACKCPADSCWDDVQQSCITIADYLNKQ